MFFLFDLQVTFRFMTGAVSEPKIFGSSHFRNQKHLKISVCPSNNFNVILKSLSRSSSDVFLGTLQVLLLPYVSYILMDSLPCTINCCSLMFLYNYISKGFSCHIRIIYVFPYIIITISAFSANFSDTYEYFYWKKLLI